MRIRVSTPGWRPQKARQNTASSPTLTNCAFTTTPANTNLEASKLSGGAVDSPSTLIKVAGNTGVSGTACATGDGLEASGSTLPTMQTVPSCQPIVHHDAGYRRLKMHQNRVPRIQSRHRRVQAPPQSTRVRPPHPRPYFPCQVSISSVLHHPRSLKYLPRPLHRRYLLQRPSYRRYPLASAPWRLPPFPRCILPQTHQQPSLRPHPPPELRPLKSTVLRRNRPPLANQLVPLLRPTCSVPRTRSCPRRLLLFRGISNLPQAPVVIPLLRHPPQHRLARPVRAH
ncbi:hypothetical protein C8Q78DRAFT_718079 [Trametes maxima]|nr:hypothetical protein C8Q78DRAFT_718079 [Trametes maxima]